LISVLAGRFGKSGAALLAAVAMSLAWGPAAPARGQETVVAVAADSLHYTPPTPKFERVITEVVLTNAVVWFYDRYIRPGGGEGFKIGIQAWKDNILNGFEWDDNQFSTNQLGHPYHGNLYFNAARSNGYGFWESVPFAFGGSFMWEHFGETHNPAWNDWISTSVGGTGLGETFFRLSQIVTDNTATGSSRAWRELGGTLVNPLRGFNRIISGDWSRVQANPPDRYPKSYGVGYRVGFRTVGQDHLWDTDTTRVFMDFAALYGDPFGGEYKKPFDSFQYAAQLNFGDKNTLGSMRARGILFGTEIKKTEHAHHLLAAYQHYDYYNNNSFEFGGQSVGATLLSQVKTDQDFEVRTQLDMNVLLLGGTKSDYINFSGRTYDFGPGLGFKFGATFSVKGRPFLILGHDQYWVHSMNGTAAEHYITGSQVRVDVPLPENLSVSVDYSLYTADRDYRDFPDVYSRIPELRTALAFRL
jgi:hypothetical protein